MSYTKGVSPHGHKLYQALLTHGPLTAAEIGSKLNIYANAVYRLTNYLTQVGLVREQLTTPKRFAAVPLAQGQENYFTFQRNKFKNLFPKAFKMYAELPQNHDIAFIHGRDVIFQKLAEDLDVAKKEANFIVLGLPIGVSPELMLAQRNAVKRGIPIKIIVQEHSETNQQTLASWGEIGLTIRLGKPLGFHLLLIDTNISYLMYYDTEDKTKRYAVRIVHPGINKELQIIFTKKWHEAKPFRH